MALPAEGDPQGSRWRWGQGAVLALTAVLLAGLWLAPARFLALFWGVVIPLLPLSFLVSPQLWRAVCPLATLNMLDQRTGRRRRSMAISRWSEAPAIIALVVLVPARHLAFNHEAWTLALLVVAAAVVAFLAGRWFEAKAGFCNLLCPVLPVERLYGQHPLLNVANPRCPSCSVCTPRGCIDLAGTKALPQLLGPRRRNTGWMLTGFGLFALAFPAFIAGYFTIPTSPVPVATAVYAHVLGWSAAGAVLSGGVIIAIRIPSRVALHPARCCRRRDLLLVRCAALARLPRHPRREQLHARAGTAVGQRSLVDRARFPRSRQCSGSASGTSTVRSGLNA